MDPKKLNVISFPIEDLEKTLIGIQHAYFLIKDVKEIPIEFIDLNPEILNFVGSFIIEMLPVLEKSNKVEEFFEDSPDGKTVKKDIASQLSNLRLLCVRLHDMEKKDLKIPELKEVFSTPVQVLFELNTRRKNN